MGKRELIALLRLSSWCLAIVVRLFLTMTRVCLQFVISLICCLLVTVSVLFLKHLKYRLAHLVDFELKKSPAPPPPLGNFADISYLKENFKLHLLRDVCTLCSGALVSDSLLHMLL